MTANRLRDYITLGEQICRVSDALATEATARLLAARRELEFRDRVIAGLVLKIDSAFRALLNDCRAHRLESMHHLKTMAEAFICFHAVASDPSSVTADRLMGEVVDQRITRLQEIPGVDEAEVHDWKELKDLLLDGRPPLRSVKRLSKHGADLSGWYSRVYRLACEPAHLGDLWEFMPEPAGGISTAPVKTAPAQAALAAYYGLRIAIATLRAVGEANDIGLDVNADAWDRQLDEIAGLVSQ